MDEQAREQVRLPDEFAIYTTCAACFTWIEAYGSCRAGVWNRTDVTSPLPALPEGWGLVDADERAHLRAELARELSAVHGLHGMRLLPLARRREHDDILLQELALHGRLWCVHLTWRHEADPRWPHAEAFVTLEAFASSRGSF